MKKRSPITTVLLLLMSVGILAAIFYVNSLLNGKNEAPVTQIKKTKASAQTYHKLLALNDVQITPIDIDPTAAVKVTPTPTDEPEVTTTIAPTKGVTPVPSVTIKPTIVASSPTVVPTIVSTTIVPPTLIPTKQSLLLAYHNPSPTVIQATEGAKTEVTKKPTLIPTRTQTLPETGWVQTSSILFIVAVSTILLSLLF